MTQSKSSKHTLRLKAGASAIFFIASVYMLEPSMALPCFFAAAFHECGHILVAKIRGIHLSEMKLDLFGARLSVSSSAISYRDEFFLCAAGPLFSLLFAVPLFLFHNAPFIWNLSAASLFLGLLNLIPVRGFDGGRMMYSLTSLLFSPSVADLFERFFTGVFLIFLWGISIYLMLITGGGLSLFVFSVGFFSKIFLS